MADVALHAAYWHLRLFRRLYAQTSPPLTADSSVQVPPMPDKRLHQPTPSLQQHCRNPLALTCFYVFRRSTESGLRRRLAQPETSEEREGKDDSASSQAQREVAPRMTKIFVSYAHSSPAHKQIVYDLVEVLRQKHLAVTVDTNVTTPQGPEEGWPKWMKRQIKGAIGS